jgi:hypothetical protein
MSDPPKVEGNAPFQHEMMDDSASACSGLYFGSFHWGLSRIVLGTLS